MLDYRVDDNQAFFFHKKGYYLKFKYFCHDAFRFWGQKKRALFKCRDESVADYNQAFVGLVP
jgi:hypothetical protein